jgi:hypothetical protein
VYTLENGVYTENCGEPINIYADVAGNGKPDMPAARFLCLLALTEAVLYSVCFTGIEVYP